MKILHISDTHGFHRDIPLNRFQDIDIIIHSGDCSNWKDIARNSNEVLDFIKWYKDVPVLHKIYVAGNHDTSIERKLITKEHFTEAGIIYLENSGITIDGIKFWGSPYTPTFGDWAFMKARHRMHDLWQEIPEDTDVLIVHGPPQGVRDLSLDRNGYLEMCGCFSLMKRCYSLKDTLKLVLFGHIHNVKNIDNQGISIYSKTPTIFSNASCVEDGKFEKGLISFGNILTL